MNRARYRAGRCTCGGDSTEYPGRHEFFCGMEETAANEYRPPPADLVTVWDRPEGMHQ